MAVYIIRAGALGLVKIGSSGNPERRIAGLAADEKTHFRVLRLLEGGLAEEKALHRRFKHLNQWGERFVYCPEMMEGDLGLPDIPVPYDLDNGHHLRAASVGASFPDLCEEALRAAGGLNAVGQRLGIAPYLLGRQHPFTKQPLIRRLYWSALVVMARDAGRHEFSLEAFEATKAVMDAEKAEGKAIKAFHRERADARSKAAAERAWIEAYGRDAAWWPLLPGHEAKGEAA